MNEWKLALNGQQLVSTEVRATGEVHPVNRNEQKRLKKSCTGCGDYFTCCQQANYDYFQSCVINVHRYLPRRYKPNLCAECGDRSGVV